MMIELNETDFDKVLHLIEGSGKNVPTFAYSVLNHYIGGAVYGDSKTPETVLIETQSGLYFIAGKENNPKFNDFLFELYDVRKSKKLRFTLFSSNEHWDEVLEKQLNDTIKQVRRYAFEFHDHNQFNDMNLLAGDYCIKRINEELIRKSLDFNEDYYKEYWGSLSNFTEKGFGYCILHEGKVISECTSIFSSPQFSEIDIATHEDYRGQGLATTISKIFIKHCLKKDIIPRWDCDISNESSIKLAGKLGFKHPVKYSIFV